jgi:hypothetical protein
LAFTGELSMGPRCPYGPTSDHRKVLAKYVSTDHDPLYRFHQWQADLRILEMVEIKTVPGVPFSHPFVERLIGTIRRECLDQTLFWTTADLADFRDILRPPRCKTRSATALFPIRLLKICERLSSLQSATPLGLGTAGPIQPALRRPSGLFTDPIPERLTAEQAERTSQRPRRDLGIRRNRMPMDPS